MKHNHTSSNAVAIIQLLYVKMYDRIINLTPKYDDIN